MDDEVNGEVVMLPELPRRYASEVQTGMERYYQLARELEEVRGQVDEARIGRAQAELEVGMLQDEIGNLRRELSAAHRTAQDARVEAAELTTALALVGSAVIEVLNRKRPGAEEKANA